MKILLVNDYATETGGAEFFVLALRDGLRQLGHDARLFASSARPLGAPGLAEIAFFALDRPGVNSVSVYESQTDAAHPCLRLGTPRAGDARPGFQFFAHAADEKDPPKATVPLYEYIDAARDRRTYSTEEGLTLPGFKRQERALCRVWPNPWRRWK